MLLSLFFCLALIFSGDLVFAQTPAAVSSGGVSAQTPVAVSSGGVSAQTPAVVSSGGVSAQTPVAVSSGGVSAQTLTVTSNTAISITKKLPLDGITICIDPGHQAKSLAATEPISPGSKVRKAMDSGGTRGIVTKTPESELVLAVGLALRDELLLRGATVVMTRETQKSRIGNVARAKVANEAKADLCIRLHADGSDNRKINGLSVLVPGDKSACGTTVAAISTKIGKALLLTVADEMKLSRNNLVKRNDLTGFNWSKVPVLLVEIGFMTNAEEDRKMADKTWRAGMAAVLADGIEKGLSLK